MTLDEFERQSRRPNRARRVKFVPGARVSPARFNSRPQFVPTSAVMHEPISTFIGLSALLAGGLEAVGVGALAAASAGAAIGGAIVAGALSVGVSFA
jgi:hypothetical protein